MRLFAVVAVVLAMVASVGGVRGQEATPTPPAYASWVQDAAERYWFNRDRATNGGWGFLQGVAYRFDSTEHASVAPPEAIEQSLLIFRDDSGDFMVRRVSAPGVGDSSQVLVDDPAGVEGADVALGFVDDEYIVILAVSAAEDRLTSAAIADLVDIAERIIGRRPSVETPVYDGNITVGGMFDLLPGYEDVPIGMSLTSEVPNMRTQPSPTPVA